MAIIDHKEWPNFTWDYLRIASQLPELRFQQGRLLGSMEALTPALQHEATLTTLSQEIIKSSEIAGENLHFQAVRAALENADTVNGSVKIILDANYHYQKALTVERLCDWHAALYPTDNGHHNDERWQFEVGRFLKWLNAPSKTDLMIKTAIAHFWFLSVAPFAAGNGLIARALTVLMLARADKTQQRFYALAPQLVVERDTYQELFATCQAGTLDISVWIAWFLNCLQRAIQASKVTLQSVISKARFWELCRGALLNERQFTIINLLLNGGAEKLNSSSWAKLTNCSQDSALRDITDLVKRSILVKANAGGRSTYYELAHQFA